MDFFRARRRCPRHRQAVAAFKSHLFRGTVMDAKKTGTSEMITTKIDFSHRRIAKLAHIAELAEMFFPGNRNQQYAFLVIWVRLNGGRRGLSPTWASS